MSVPKPVSDFIDENDFRNALTIANRKHDIVAIQVYDRRMAELPDVGLMKVRDAETGHEQWIDTSSRALQSANLMLRALGLSMYLACLGLDAGTHFFETVMRPEGALWLGR